MFQYIDCHKSILNIYDFNKKEIINKKTINRVSGDILILPKKEMLLMVVQSFRNGKDVKCFDIIGLNYNCQEICIWNKPIYNGGFRFKYFKEKNEKEDIILIYQGFGYLNFISLKA